MTPSTRTLTNVPRFQMSHSPSSFAILSRDSEFCVRCATCLSARVALALDGEGGLCRHKCRCGRCVYYVCPPLCRLSLYADTYTKPECFVGQGGHKCPTTTYVKSTPRTVSVLFASAHDSLKTCSVSTSLTSAFCLMSDIFLLTKIIILPPVQIFVFSRRWRRF